MPFTVLSRIKYIRVNLTTDVKDMYIENDMTLMKEMEEHTNK